MAAKDTFLNFVTPLFYNKSVLFRSFHKPNRQRINAVAGIFGSHSFTLKNVTQMPATIGTTNFYPAHPKGTIHVPRNSTRQFIVKRGPAAPGIKFVTSIVQRCVATAANKNAIAFKVPIFARKCPFSAFLGNNVFFFRGKCVPIFHV